MFIFLFYILLNVKLISSFIIVQDAGLYKFEKNDMALIFFVTVENTYDCKIPISVYNIQCLEGDPASPTANHMFLLGGDMGFINTKTTRNLTLIYPNLYLQNRIGKCLVSVLYQTDQTVNEIRREIYFNSDKVFDDESSAVDCVVKYSSRRSYFSKEYQTCVEVPECPPNAVYLPKSNICRKLHESVCPNDLEMIEDSNVEKVHDVSNLVNYECHHGSAQNATNECICENGWTTSMCDEAAYHPTLNLYHMCNIQIDSWQTANKEKILMTIFVLLILAIGIAAKMLLAVCLLNWCCHLCKTKNDRCCIVGPYGSYCGEEACEADEGSSRTIRVSFSNTDAVTTEGETDVTYESDRTDN